MKPRSKIKPPKPLAESRWTKHDRALEIVREYFPHTTKAEAVEILMAANRGNGPENTGWNDADGIPFLRHEVTESMLRRRLDSTRALFMHAFGIDAGEADE